jgi:hypothetical protein
MKVSGAVPSDQMNSVDWRALDILQVFGKSVRKAPKRGTGIMGKNRKDLPNKQRYPPAVIVTVYKRFDYIGLQAVFSGIRIALYTLRSCPNLESFRGRPM